MTELSFKEDDRQKFVEFLNIIAKNAVFTLKTDEIISYFRLLSHMQQSILPKINANILEIIKVSEAKPEEVKQPKARASKASASEG